MQDTKISWTNATWNPVTGCTKVSAGCSNCYAEQMHNRLRAMGQKKYQSDFNQIKFHWQDLDLPMKWKKPRMIFVNSMSDLFHEKISYEYLCYVLQMINKCKHHTFQVLTKRPEQALIFFNEAVRTAALHAAQPNVRSDKFNAASMINLSAGMGLNAGYIGMGGCELFNKHNVPQEDRIFPYPNLWLGVTVESQATISRIETLKKIPAKLRFLSFEPLLSEIKHVDLQGIDWAIIGCESGTQRRPCNIEWVENLVGLCREYNVPVFVKQLNINGKVVKDMSQFPVHLRIQEYPD